MSSLRLLPAIDPAHAARIGRWCDALSLACPAIEPWRLHGWARAAATDLGALSARRIERSLRLDGPAADGCVDASAAGGVAAHLGWLRTRPKARAPAPDPTVTADAAAACRSLHRALLDEPCRAAPRLAALVIVSLRVADPAAAGRDVELVLLGPRGRGVPFNDTVLRGQALVDALRALCMLGAIARPHLPAGADVPWADLDRIHRVCVASGRDEARVEFARHLLDDLLDGRPGMAAPSAHDGARTEAAHDGERHRLLRAGPAPAEDPRLALPAALTGLVSPPPQQPQPQPQQRTSAQAPVRAPESVSPLEPLGVTEPADTLPDPQREALATPFAVDPQATAEAGLDAAEVDRLARYGTWYERLADGRLMPGSDAQRRFVLVAKGRAEPVSEHERLWRRYRTAVRRLAILANAGAAPARAAPPPAAAAAGMPSGQACDAIGQAAPQVSPHAPPSLPPHGSPHGSPSLPPNRALTMPQAESVIGPVDGRPTIPMSTPQPDPVAERSAWTSPSSRMLLATLERATSEELLELTRALEGQEATTAPLAPAALAARIGIAGRSGLTTAVSLGGAAYLEMLRDAAEALGVDAIWWASRNGPSGVDLAAIDASRPTESRLPPDRDAVAALYAWVDELETEVLKAILAVLQRGLDAPERARFAHDLLLRARRHGVDLSDSVTPGGVLVVVHLGGFATYTALSTALGIVAPTMPGMGGYTLASSLLGAMLGPAGRMVLADTVVWRSFGPNARRIVRLVATAAMIRQGAAASASAAAARRTRLPEPA
jgi:hypothetical protein